MNIRNISPLITIPLVFGAGLIAGLFVPLRLTDEKPVSTVEIRQGGNIFTNPLLECEIGGEQVDFRELRPFKYKISGLVDKKIRQKEAAQISVYFRDLSNGMWFGINEKAGFSPASLLKVPIMIACLKGASADPSFLERQILYDGRNELNSMENIQAAGRLVPGRRYPVEYLLSRMMNHSDNNATVLLLQNIDPKTLTDVYVDLGITVPGRNTPEDFMSVKLYGAFFRILYNASYLSREMSEKALAILSQTDFRRGLVAGVPEGVTVAHKFGERAFTDKPVKQLHDCGIVYHSRFPYLLCIMSRGENFEVLADTIREISQTVYFEVDHQEVLGLPSR